MDMFLLFSLYVAFGAPPMTAVNTYAYAPVHGKGCLELGPSES